MYVKFLLNDSLAAYCVLGILLCLSGVSAGPSVIVVELTTDWTLSNQTATIPNLKLPTGVYSALYGEQVLQSYNDVDLRWIAYDNWTYTKTFIVNPTDYKHVRFVNLTFHGIDTVSEISLNGVLLGRTDNMFVRYSYDVTKTLGHENVLEVRIKSPVYAALEKANKLNESSMGVPPYCPSASYKGECHMNMLRKMQASFSWDWGLAAPSMGIWKSVTLESYEVALIRDVDVVIDKNSTHWNMHIRVFIDVGGHRDFYADLTFYAVEILTKPVIISDYRKTPISHISPVITFEQAIPITDVRTWWPNGYGEQKLYPLHFTLTAWLDEDGPSLRRKVTSEKSIRVGFRTIELVEDPAPAGDGNTFLFKVNGQEMFMKGTNYIPSHILPEYSADQERIRHLLFAAKEAHMNMIRVWGGGIYESEYFYDTADHYGILIWQDMMFACAMYPATEDFLASVREETLQNAKRIGHHPSVAIFATNNENELALVSNWYGTRNERARFESEYRELYLGTVMHELKIIQHSARPRPLVSSPANGKEEEKSNYISENPQDPNYGDVHFYDIFRDGWNPKIYPKPRFASEYGFQSLPKMQSWHFTKSAEDDLQDLIQHRQHHPAGMLCITNLVRQHLPLPLPESAAYPEALIYFSQISQAMATKVETELYRSLRDTDHRTMGALYWQLNDVWVAPSWSSIDFYGNYKLLHHWAREFMAPTSIIALYNSSTASINVMLTCDLFEVDASDLQVTMDVFKWSDLYPKNSTTWNATLKPNGVQYDKVIPLKDVLVDDFTTKNSFLEFSLKRNSKVISSTFYFPGVISAAVGVVDPILTFEISSKYCTASSSIVMNNYSLTISVKHPAIFVYIEIRHPEVYRYKLSRNGYMQLVPVQVVHVEFEDDECINITSDHIKVFTVNQYML